MKATLVMVLVAASAAPAAPPNEYVKKASRADTVRATLKANGLPDLEGKWFWIGPFDNAGGAGFDAAYPPEKEIDLAKTYPGKGDAKLAWAEFKGFPLGTVVDLKKVVPKSDDTVVYLDHEFANDGKEPILMPLSLGSDDTLSVCLNGKRLIHENHTRAGGGRSGQGRTAIEAGQERTAHQGLQRPGRAGEVYVTPETAEGGRRRPCWPSVDRDFPPAAGRRRCRRPTGRPRPSTTRSSRSRAGRLRAGSRRPRLPARRQAARLHPPRRSLADRQARTPTTRPRSSSRRFASGLHEALGLHVEDDKTVYVVQRPELTKLVDKDGDGVADEYATVCDKWGVSGDYHEFAFGPARDKDGNFYITLNVGFGGGHQAKAPWRGLVRQGDAQGRDGAVGLRPALAQRHQLLARTATCSTATTRASGWRRTRCTTSARASSTATRPGCGG